MACCEHTVVTRGFWQSSSTPSPGAYSVLVFGQTGDSSSEHFDDQTEMFSRGELKPVSFTEDQIEADLVRSYRPDR